MTKFTDQLLDDLMAEHGPTLARTRPPAAPKRHPAAGRALLVTGAGGVVIAATVGALVASGGGTPAYALTTHPDGTVTLDVYQASGITGINTKLHQLGDDQVVVVPAEPGCPGLGSLPKPAVSAKGHQISVESGRSKDGSITVNAQGIPAGDILVVGSQTSANGTMTGAALTSPPAPACVSLPAPPPGGGSGSGTSSGTAGGSGPVTSGTG